MSTDLAMRPPAALAVPSSAPTPERVFEAWLDSLSPNTRTAYWGDCRRFAAFRGVEPVHALAELLAVGPGQARLIAHEYLAALEELSSASKARRLASLRSYVRFAHRTALIAWFLDVASPKVTAYRDVRGPDHESIKTIFTTLAAQAAMTAKGKRDLAMISLLYCNALRRAEVVGLDVEDVELGPDPCVWILGKGKTDRERSTINARTRAALAGWLEVRGPEPGALFLPLDRSGKGEGRLTANGLQKLVTKLGKAAKIERHMTPHQFRHAAATHTAEKTGDAFKVKAIGRWAKLETADRYVDASKDVQGEVTAMLGDDLPAW